MRLRVYAVHVALEGGEKRWLYSIPLDPEEAEREAHTLKATGHLVEVMSMTQARTRQRKERRARG